MLGVNLLWLVMPSAVYSIKYCQSHYILNSDILYLLFMVEITLNNDVLGSLRCCYYGASTRVSSRHCTRTKTDVNRFSLYDIKSTVDLLLVEFQLSILINKKTFEKEVPSAPHKGPFRGP